MNDTAGVLKKIQEIVKESDDGDYIYRGEPECYDHVSSNLWRKYRKIDAENFDIEVVQNDLLKAAKGFARETDDHAILAQIQHYGGETNLIDFTTDYLIALFFACDSHNDKDGRIILLQKPTSDIVKPQIPVNRVIAQKSIFVRPPKGFIEPNKTIIILKSLKQSFLEYLRNRHGITAETIYNDVHGFIKYQNIHQSAYVEFYAGLTWEDKKDYLKAIEHYSNAIGLNPELYRAYNNRGTTYLSKAELDRAIEDFDKTIELKPDDAVAYNNRGNAYDRKAEPDQAIKDYNKAIQLKPNDATAYNNRGIAYLSKDEPDQAIEDFDKAIQLKPDDAVAYNNRGNAYDRKGELDQAIKDYNKAIQLKPGYAKVYNNRGNAYDRKGEPDQAIEDFEKAIQLKPGYAIAYYNRGNAYLSKDELDRAIEDFEKAIQLKPDDAKVYNNRGNAYLSKDELDRAIEDFEKAIELNPELPSAHFNRGMYWLHLQKWQKAQSDLTDAKNMGTDIIAEFRNDYGDVRAFEQKIGITLPKDIAAMLTQ